MEKAMFAAGCFWGVQASLDELDGVVRTTVGYSGGDTKDPTYNDVCTGRTGHAEVVLVEFTPGVISFEELLDHFWSIHDPTTINRQGPDVGSQYRSAVFFFSPDQERIARKRKDELDASEEYYGPVVTEITPSSTFYPAEEYHQRYFEKNPENISCHL